MRVAEKTVETNFCAQATVWYVSLGQLAIWFGLTQAQEAKAGFDAATRIGGRLLIFQFKASNQNVVLPAPFSTGRRFRAKHDQMQRLRDRCALSRSVYYAFPLVGTTAELPVSPLILADTWLLDVGSLPATIPPPTGQKGQVRKSGNHYVDVGRGLAIIRSEPIESRVGRLFELENASVQGEHLSPRNFRTFEEFWQFRQLLSRSAAAVLLTG
jgi:hypothetical protein